MPASVRAHRLDLQGPVPDQELPLRLLLNDIPQLGDDLLVALPADAADLFGLGRGLGAGLGHGIHRLRGPGTAPKTVSGGGPPPPSVNPQIR